MIIGKIIKGVFFSAILLLGIVSCRDSKPKKDAKKEGVTKKENMQRPPKNENFKKPPSFSQLLEDMDANNDGKLSEQEIKGPLKNDFSTVDKNEDGFITEEEFKNAPKPREGERDENREDYREDHREEE